MGIDEEAADGTAVPKTEIRIDCDPTVSYASHQNSIPVAHSISVVIGPDRAYRDVEVVLTPEPPFAEAIRYRYELLEAGDTRTITPIQLKLQHRFLADLTEAEVGRIHVELRSEGQRIAEAESKVSVLAFDQWGGTRSVPELLAAFSCPNNPHVDRVLYEAGELLGKDGKGVALNGYDSKNREVVWAQISAIYSAVAARGIQYSLPPASFASSGQKIRPPDRIFSGGVATCLDFTMLLASCLEAAGLNPIILLNDGHAWVGCWLINTSFSTCLTDDVLAVRKRVDAGEMLVFETTGLGLRPLMSLRLARESGYRHLVDDAAKFSVAIDVRRARIERINPLPSRDAVPLEEKAMAEMAIAVESAPVLPTLIGETVLLDEEEAVETPDGRLTRWKSKLLDLTLRNRLLNFKPSKVMIPLRVPDPFLLEDTLSDGEEWRFRPLPPIMEGADPRSRAIARTRDGEDPVEAMAKAAMAKHELMASLDPKKLDQALYEVFLTVRNGLEETGANTLFLALGFLRWAEDERAEKTYLAPLLLVPVTLKRASVKTGFSIVRHDDDTIVNPTLLQALREKHGVNVKGVDPPPTDAKGVDVEKIWAIFREAVKDIPRWEVVADVYLGVFSFHKFVMYSDLKNRTEDLRKSKIVSHLIDRPREGLGSSDIRRCDDIDDTHGPGDLLAPMSADSSQLNALRRANEGHDFVLEGPPGTGKSQTITNLIVDFLGKGKKVLFVSEKMAALQVVERRLKEVELGPFCLQLHSAKAVKSEVLGQLKNTLEVGSAMSPSSWEMEVERIATLRNELNSLVRALHREHANGLTVRGAIDTAIKHRHWPLVPIELATVDSVDQKLLLGLRQAASSMQAAAVALGELKHHPLKAIRTKDWSHGWEAELLPAGEDLTKRCAELLAAANELSKPFDLPLQNSSLKMLADVDNIAEVILQAPSIPSGFAQHADDPRVRGWLEVLRRHGEARNVAWQDMAPTMKPTVARLRGDELESEWAIASSKWIVPRWLGQRAVSEKFIVHMLSAKRPPTAEMPSTIARLTILNSEDAELKASESKAKDLLEQGYRAEETDWKAIQRFEAWGARLQDAIKRFTTTAHPQGPGEFLVRVKTLVGPQRHLLEPTGDLARRLLTYRQSYRSFIASAAHAEKLAHSDERFGFDSEVAGALDGLSAIGANWNQHRASLRTWCLWNTFKAKLQGVGQAKVLDAIERGAVRNTEIAEFIEFSNQVWWLKGIMDRDEALRTFSGAVHEQKIHDFREADSRFQTLTKKMVYAALARGVPRVGTDARSGPEMALLSREIQKQRQHLPIRKLVKSLPGVLPALKPCLLMSPLSVAQYLDASHPQFDLVIFDEASQIPVWDAVGVIARGKQVIVVGDPKQLPPTAFFDRGDSDDGVDVPDDAAPKDLESILDECMATGMSRLSLNWHYRSRHESLIAFSNQHYYESRLITFPSPVTKDSSVKLVPMSGTYDRGASRTNKVEAEAVVKRVIAHFDSPDPAVRKQTIGVVTFNATQMRLIDELLNAELVKRPDIEERMATHDDERLFIKNLENVQGDERDIILFSTTFGRDSSNRPSMNFGPINQSGGERRLNVAVTRARQQVEIFSSLRPEDIDLSKTRAAGVADLKAYLDFALRGPAALASQASFTGRDPDSPFEIEVIDTIREAGWEAHPQVGCSGYRIDIGVVDKGAPGAYLAGVECDGATYHSMASARDRDRLRQSVLEGLGWTIRRVWSTDWWMDRGRCKKELIAALEQLQREVDASRNAEREKILES